MPIKKRPAGNAAIVPRSQKTIVLDHWRTHGSNTNWFEEMNASLTESGLKAISRSRVTQITSQHQHAQEDRKARIYTLHVGREHLLVDFASAAARYRVRLSLSKRFPGNAAALLQCPEHTRDGLVTFPGTEQTVAMAMDRLYVAEVHVQSSPFVKDATEYLNSVRHALLQNSEHSEDDVDFRIFLETYALFFFGSKAYIGTCQAVLTTEGAKLIKESRAWAEYIDAVVTQRPSQNPFHAVYSPNKRRHRAVNHPFARQREKQAEDSTDDEPDSGSAAGSVDMSVRRLRLALYVEEMLSFAQLQSLYTVVSNFDTCEQTFKRCMHMPAFGGTGFSCKNWVNLLCFAAALWPKYDFTPSGSGPRNFIGLYCGYPRKHPRFQNAGEMSHSSMHVHLELMVRWRTFHHHWAKLSLGDLAWSLLSKHERCWDVVTEQHWECEVDKMGAWAHCGGGLSREKGRLMRQW